MRKITLICSGHRERGRCNSHELLMILRALNPSVIFEEFRPSEFDAHFRRGNLEARAIQMYRDLSSFQEIPVDQFEMPEDLPAEFQKIFDCVERGSRDYRELTLLNDENVFTGGFPYLNSVIYEKMDAKLCEIEAKTILGTGDQDLIRGFKIWKGFHKEREFSMVKNIYEFARKNAFDVGAFLIGAAHKNGVKEAIRKFALDSPDSISWNLSFDQ